MIPHEFHLRNVKGFVFWPVFALHVKPARWPRVLVAGTYRAGVVCIVCPAGIYSTVTGATSASACVPCPAGAFSNGTGASACVSYPAGLSSANGSMSITNCTCNAGTYLTDSKRYPPGPLTGYSTSLNTFAYGNGLYTASVSTEYANLNPAFSAFNYFNNYGYSWTPSTTYEYGYQGTTTTIISGNSYKGDWLQIQLPKPIVLRNYNIYTHDWDFLRGPKDFYIAGSNDGLIWFLVDSRTSTKKPKKWWDGRKKEKTFAP
jgi:hypothetical protein